MSGLWFTLGLLRDGPRGRLRGQSLLLFFMRNTRAAVRAEDLQDCLTLAAFSTYRFMSSRTRTDFSFFSGKQEGDLSFAPYRHLPSDP